ncbi:S-adenosyl-L-methionine-dependent methyltransferase [Xylaria sp. FL0064]|nr:S-adenosyl-L-methionine-dependent methyltransferase [Xylaria sp. FL0064]
MPNPLEKVKQLFKDSSSLSKRDLLTRLHELIVSVETAEETATRIALYPLQTSVAKIGYMASVELIREVGTDLFEANKECQSLASSEATTILTNFFENGGPLFQAMPTFLRDNKYRDVMDGKPTVHQIVHNTDKDTYDWLSEHPEQKSSLVKFMALEQAARDSWLDKYPLERETKSWNPAMPVFVDVGGNVGHSCALFKKRVPEVPGRVILQDLPTTIEHALQTPSVETMGHSFFEEQPIKGSKYYHLGWVLHNWNDEKARQILLRIKLAMTPASVLLINGMILPDSGVPVFAASLDLVMLCAFRSRERTMKEWKDLLASVGLFVKEYVVHNSQKCHGIIIATLPQGFGPDSGTTS